MCPTPAISTSVTRGKTFVSSRVTPLEAPGESEPVRQRVGTSSAANADNGAGSVNAACYSAATLPIAVATASRRGSGMPAQVPAPIQ